MQESPWDMTSDNLKASSTDDFHTAVNKYEFASTAVAIRSAEGWHEHFSWTDQRQDEAVSALTTWAPSDTTAPPPICTAARATCRHSGSCSARRQASSATH